MPKGSNGYTLKREFEVALNTFKVQTILALGSAGDFFIPE
jgi:hypothetical protein